MKNIKKPPKKVLAIAKKVRKALELRATLDGWSKDLGGMCMIGARLLDRELRKAGFKSKWILGFYDGASHCWTEYDEWIIDPTATQFGKYPKVRILSKKYKGLWYGYFHWQHSNEDRDQVAQLWPRHQRVLPRIKI